MAQKPLVLTRGQITKYYGVTKEEAEELTRDLEPVGVYYRTDIPLYSRYAIDARIKQ